MSNYIVLLEKRAIGIEFQLKTKKISIANANFGGLLAEMKKHDEALWEQMFAKYIKTVRELKEEELTK